MICEMEVVSDSSSDSVIISGPIPDYIPELKKKKHNTAQRVKRRKDDDDQGDITLDEKVEKIQELEDLVNASASIPIGSDHLGDGDAGNWSGSDTKSLKGGKPRSSAGKYLKKIKTLQQNKRRQETRISRLTKEVRSLRDKNSVQAAYIDVLCGMLGEDMKEKFRDRQGMGILGNVKADDEDQISGKDRNEDGAGAWHPDEGGGRGRNHRDESEMKEKEDEFYCVEELDNLPSTSSRVALNDSMEDLPIEAEGEGSMEHQDENGDANDEGMLHTTNPIKLEIDDVLSVKRERIEEDKQEQGNNEVEDVGDKGMEEPEGPEAEKILENGSTPENQTPTVERQVASDEFTSAEVPSDGYKESQVAREEFHTDAQVANDEYVSSDEYPTDGCPEYDAVPLSEEGDHRYGQGPETENPGKEFTEASGNARRLVYGVEDSSSCIFQYSACGNHTLPSPETLPDHLNLQELLENGNHFLNFKDTAGTENGNHFLNFKDTTGTENGNHFLNFGVTARTENSTIQDYKVAPGAGDMGHEVKIGKPLSPTTTTEDVENIAPYGQQPATSDLC